MAVMAKAGLFLPVSTEHRQGKGRSQTTGEAPPESKAGEAAAHQDQPRLLWFDKVLADVGDGQNLQQSLSTFSGHVRRLRGVLAACTPQSLVLLDEVGPDLCPDHPPG